MTTLALALTAVRLPPKSAPSARAHHSTEELAERALFLLWRGGDSPKLEASRQPGVHRCGPDVEVTGYLFGCRSTCFEPEDTQRRQSLEDPAVLTGQRLGDQRRPTEPLNESGTLTDPIRIRHEDEKMASAILARSCLAWLNIEYLGSVSTCTLTAAAVTREYQRENRLRSA
ncbi:hypothetical protein [Mycobacterium sp. URHB0021]